MTIKLERINNDYYGNPRFKIISSIEELTELKKVKGGRLYKDKCELIVQSYDIQGLLSKAGITKVYLKQWQEVDLKDHLYL